MKTQKSASGFNKWFRAKNNSVFTYNQERCGFFFNFYCKRKVLDNGIDSEVLNLELCPEKRDLLDVENVSNLVEMMND